MFDEIRKPKKCEETELKTYEPCDSNIWTELYEQQKELAEYLHDYQICDAWLKEHKDLADKLNKLLKDGDK